MSTQSPSASSVAGIGEVTAQLSAAAHDVSALGRQVIAEVKPKLRGWLHAALVPVTLVSGLVLVMLSPTATARIGSAVFAGSALTLFTVSAVMHRGSWSPRTGLLLRRLDHASIFLLIAGSYTPFTLLLLTGAQRVTLLAIVWGGAVLGMAFRVLWSSAPRWLYTPIYIALGWTAVFFLDDFVSHGSPLVVGLIAAGGLLYTIGGVVYGLRRPNPFPAWFGFHEVFHAFTVVAFATHYAGVSLAAYAAR